MKSHRDYATRSLLALLFALSLAACSKPAIAPVQSESAPFAVQSPLPAPSSSPLALEIPADGKGQAVFGRVLRGQGPDDFKTLSADPTRKIVFLMDADGLRELKGMRLHELLLQIGYTPDYIDALFKKKTVFKLAVFRKNGNVRPGTWDGVITLASKVYPKLAGKLKRALPELKSLTFAQIESQAPSPFSAVYEAGPLHADYIDAEKLARRKGELWEVRAFLYHQLRLTELFSGDGFTHTSNGTKGAAEFVAINGKLKSFPGLKLIDLDYQPAH